MTSYESLKINHEIFLPYSWDCIFLDEGHKIKNPDADTTLICKQLRVTSFYIYLFIEIILFVYFSFFSHLIELFSLDLQFKINFLNYGLYLILFSLESLGFFFLISK